MLAVEIQVAGRIDGDAGRQRAGLFVIDDAVVDRQSAGEGTGVRPVEGQSAGSVFNHGERSAAAGIVANVSVEGPVRVIVDRERAIRRRTALRVLDDAGSAAVGDARPR